VQYTIQVVLHVPPPQGETERNMTAGVRFFFGRVQLLLLTNGIASFHFFLGTLMLNHNQFTGKLPPNMSLLVDAHIVALNDNLLTGTIHTSIGAMDDLQQLSFQNNQLTGTIPTQLGNCFRLIELHLHNNQLTGEIPTTLENCGDLATLQLEGNNFAGVSVPPQVCALDDLTSLSVDCGDDKVSCSCCGCVA
jgi:hypothetical protein